MPRSGKECRESKCGVFQGYESARISQTYLTDRFWLLNQPFDATP